MDRTVQPLKRARTACRRREPLSLLPALTLALFLLPIAAGLLGTALPAFGYLPALGGEAATLAPWRALLAHPSLPGALRLTLVSGLLSTFAALLLTLTLVAGFQGTRGLARIERLLAPLLALPHAATAIGLAFLIAPSGLLIRLVSPWLSGFQLPPDIALAPDPFGLALTLGLLVKELPFLLLMALAALGQVKAGERLATARSLGYGPVVGWLKTVLPAVYPQLRLPVYAVLAFALSTVDMAIVLAPATPPPLAVLLFRWFQDPELALRFVAAAGALLQLALVVAAVALWRLGEHLLAALGRRWLFAGARGSSGRLLPRLAAGASGLVFALGFASLLVLALWSLAWRWRFPDSLPSTWTFENWLRQAPRVLEVGGTTLLLALAAALLALLLTVGCLENEQRRDLKPGAGALWLLYLPLLVPQVAFLFGLQVLLAATGLEGSWPALLWSHLLFVLPYVFLALARPYRSLDRRFGRTALCLGARPARVFLRVTLPMLLRPLLFAFAVGVAVSVAQYLPTLFAGAGRHSTLTTEAVALASGADRRVVAVFAFLQAALPLLVFAAALAFPRWHYRERRGLGAWA